MTAVAGLRGTGSFGTDERPKNFREMIQFLNPNGDTPLFGLTSKVKKRTVDDPEYAWWDEPNDLVRLQVNGSHTSGLTLINVDSGDPDSTTLDKNWGTATNLKPGDLLMVEPASDNATFAPEFIRVTSVISDTQFNVERGAAGSTAATINDNVFLLLMGSAYAEGTASPDATSRNPIKYSNFVQIFKESYELTGTVDATRFRTGDPWSNDKKRKMYDHARAIEWSMFFGKSSETTGTNGKPLRTMGGLRSQIPATRSTIFSIGATTNLSMFHFLDSVYRCFDYSTPAGDERVMFAGNVALNALNKMVQSDPNADITWGGIVKSYGMNLRELILPQGRLLIRSHPMLNRHASYAGSTYTPGIYAASAWVIDFSALEYVTLKGRDTRTKDDVQQKDEDIRRGFVQTDCSLQVDFGGLSCAYLGGMTSANLATS